VFREVVEPSKLALVQSFSDAEAAAFEVDMEQMAQGLVGTFEQLDAHLAAAKSW